MTHEILVLGAGYAGLAAASRAAHNIRRDALDARITLVNAAPDFVERVRLHQVAAGQDVGVHPLSASLDGTGVDLVLGRVEHVDTGRRTVRVRAGGQEGREGRTEPEREISYDTLVYALGSDAGSGGVPGAAGHAHNAASLGSARALARRIREDAPRSVAVVGGGLTGLEVATEVAESHPGLRVELLTRGRVADGLSPRGRAHVHRVLSCLGVSAREGVCVAGVDSAGLRLADGSRVDADLVVCNAGFGVAPLAAEAGLTVDRDGRAVVGTDQRSVSHPDVYVVGTPRTRSACTAIPSGCPARWGCPWAGPQPTRSPRGCAGTHRSSRRSPTFSSA
ncbi:NAD(P)/FAD-dependent oxidoreductase [Nocardiopsis metallicus]|uniref:NADH dehydrogenase FAD-containing subunit n=1 Tax=Nocardiopsis metallicus TaxID=179819 RepID=A0A840W224_9ACTN|nr:FAD-dependent oxidoreductase [Nocardiopsis metallicus]MBB5490112.1 NADH dehydrogenase FAD-containing subunit [Nocardiopsis metallicus]